MTTRSLDHLNQLTPEQRAEVEDRIEAFEQAWQRGEHPAITDHLPADPEVRNAALVELIHIDLEFRIKAGEAAHVESYLKDFPDADQVVELIRAEFLCRENRGQGAELPEHERRFPQLASRLGSLLDTRKVAGDGQSNTPPSLSPPAAQGDRNLLFGILALQMDFISRDALIAAMHAWVLKKSKPLGEILVEQGQLAAEVQSMLDALVDKHIAQHWGDPQQSLAALRLPPAVQRDLEQFADPDVHATLARLATIPPKPLAEQTTRPMPENYARSDDRFNILRRHAWGGLGEVYVAQDLELNREVALKRLHERHADNEDSRARFVQEAEVTGGLEHPGIVPVYGLGTSADGRPYYAMRFIRGQTLKEAIERFHSGEPRTESDRRIELRQLLTRFIAVCNAIEYAHSRGVIHRDIKPNNIMLGKYGETLVVDWGLAKALGRRAEDAPRDEHTLVPSSGSGSSETLPGSAMGTPAYMSPEQSEGRIDEIGPASDVYSLGATLYTILTGKEPFESSIIGVILGRVQTGDFVPPRVRNPAVPRALDAICLKAMRLLPKDRYPSCAALASDVEHWLADEPVTALKDPLSDRLIRWIKRHRVLAATSAALTAAAVIGLLAGTLLLSKANREIEVAAAEARIQRDDATQQRQVAQAERAAAIAERQRADANAARADERRKEAQVERERAEAALNRSEWRLYASQIAAAQRDWDSGNVSGARQHLNSCRWDFRGWEYDYLHTLFNKNQTTVHAHPFEVTSVAFSPDGKRILSGGGDHAIKVWDATTGQETLTFDGDTPAVFSPDGKRIVGASDADKTIKVWDATSGQETLALKGHTKYVASVAFSPDGRRIVSGSEDKTLKVWDATSGREMLTLKGHTRRVSSVAFSPDGKRIVSGGGDETLKVWDATSGREVLTLKGHMRWVNSVAFSPDGKRVVSGSDDKTIKVWDAASGQETLTLKGHTDQVNTVAFSPDGKRIVSESDDGTLKRWDATSGQETLTLKEHTGYLRSGAFSPDGKQIVSEGVDETLNVWDATSGRETRTLKGHSPVAFSFDGTRIASGSDDDKTIKVWESASGKEMLTLKGHTDHVTSVAFSPDGKRIVSGSFDKTIKVWDATSGRETLTLKGHTSRVQTVAFSPDGQRIVSASMDRTIKVWDATSGQVMLTVTEHTGAVTGAAFSADGKRIITGSLGGTIKIWDASKTTQP